MPGMGGCMPMLVIFSLFGLMAPKAKSKAKAKATGKRTREEEDTQEREHIGQIKVERDAKGQYPAIPTEELNKLNSRFHNLKTQGIVAPAELARRLVFTQVSNFFSVEGVRGETVNLECHFRSHSLEFQMLFCKAVA